MGRSSAAPVHGSRQGSEIGRGRKAERLTTEFAEGTEEEGLRFVLALGEDAMALYDSSRSKKK